MLNTSFSPWPSYSPAEIEAVASVLESNRVNYWTGEESREFEREFAIWTGTTHAVAVANGTLALDLSLKALDIGSGDEVVVTPRTFIASISAVVNAGATPVFADVDLDSGNISAATIEPVLTARTRAIIPVHLGGWPADMDAILDLVRPRSIAVVEDCAQAHGAKIGGRMVGSVGDIGAWSFCQDKIMTTGGEGGMVTTGSEELWSRMWSFKDHGKSWQAIYEKEHPPGFRWVHESFGTNWRMLEMQAVLGRIQLSRMGQWTARRTEIATRYAEVLRRHADLVRVPMPGPGFIHAFYRLYAYIRPDALGAGWSRDRILAALDEAGVPARQGSCSEVYLEKAFDNTGWRPDQRLPNARELGETSIMFFTHPTITDEQLSRACSSLDDVFTRISR